MEYKLTIHEETIPVEINSSEENKATVMVDERAYDVKYARISENELHLMVDGKSVNVYVSKNSSGKTMMLNGKLYQVQDADRVSKGPKKRKGFDGPRIVTSQMPAIVIAVKVKEGDIVQKGQGVVVVSAMKMETTLNAPYNGVVTRVNVTENAKVMPGEVLVDIDEIKVEEVLETENE